MITIHIKKPKSAQMNRVQKGCGMRITEGDTPLLVKKELYNKIKNKFKNGKAHTLYSHEFEGGSLTDMYNQAKEAVKTEVRQTARQAKKEAVSVAKELQKQAIKEGNLFVKDVAKPYLTEMVQAGIVGLGGTAAALQPELAPWIGAGTLALSSMAGQYIEDFGKKPPKKKSAYVSPQDYNVIQQYQAPVPENYVNPHEVARSKLNESVDDFQRANNMIGFGFNKGPKVGCGLYAGGGLVSRDGYTPPALMSPKPEWMMNRNIMPAYIQNMTY